MLIIIFKWPSIEPWTQQALHNCLSNGWINYEKNVNSKITRKDLFWPASLNNSFMYSCIRLACIDWIMHRISVCVRGYQSWQKSLRYTAKPPSHCSISYPPAGAIRLMWKYNRPRNTWKKYSFALIIKETTIKTTRYILIIAPSGVGVGRQTAFREGILPSSKAYVVTVGLSHSISRNVS